MITVAEAAKAADIVMMLARGRPRLFTLLKAPYTNDVKAKMAESRLHAISSHRSYMPKTVDVKQKIALFFERNWCIIMIYYLK